MIANGHLQVFVDGRDVGAVLPVDATPSGGFGVYVEPGARFAFSNLYAASLRKKH